MRALALLGAAVLTVAMVGMTPAAPTGASKAFPAAGTPFAQARFASYATGSEVHVGALTAAPTPIAGVEQAFSGVSTNSGGLAAPLNSMTIPPALIQPGLPGANAYGRGSGLEVGLGTTPAVANQLRLGIAESAAPPTSAPVVKTVLPINLPGVLTAGVLKGIAASAYSPTFCPVGQPIALGEGDAAGVGLLGTPPLLQISGNAGVTQAAQSISRTDLVANADGTFGLQSTVHEIVAPVIVNLDAAIQLQITVQGAGPDAPITMSSFTDGQGHQTAGVANSADQVVIALVHNGMTTPLVNLGLNALLGSGGLILSPSSGGPIGTLLSTLAAMGVNIALRIATPPVTSLSTNFALATFDLVTLNVILTGPLGIGGVANMNIGHMETGVALPGGSIACTVPVAKMANPPAVQAGSSFTWNISVPMSATDLADSSCDLTHIKVTDLISTRSGSPTFTIGAISNGGVYDATTNTVTWADIGNYHPGDPPIVLAVSVSVPGDSPAGVLEDTATVTAGLGNCTGGATGVATAIGNVGSAIIGGSITLVAPEVTAVAVTTTTTSTTLAPVTTTSTLSPVTTTTTTTLSPVTTTTTTTLVPATTTTTAPATNTGAPLATTGTEPTRPWIAAGLLIAAVTMRRLLRRANRQGQSSSR